MSNFDDGVVGDAPTDDAYVARCHKQGEVDGFCQRPQRNPIVLLEALERDDLDREEEWHNVFDPRRSPEWRSLASGYDFPCRVPSRHCIAGRQSIQNDLLNALFGPSVRDLDGNDAKRSYVRVRRRWAHGERRKSPWYAGGMNPRELGLGALSDDTLLVRLDEEIGKSRCVEAKLVALIAEVDARRLYLREACPSMYAYAIERLHLSGSEAYLRIAVARLSRRIPLVLTMLADGRLHLSGISKLAPHLRGDNAEAVLTRAAHRSKREIEALVAELAPKPDAPALIRRLPGPGAAPSAAASATSSPAHRGETREQRPDGAGLGGGGELRPEGPDGAGAGGGGAPRPESPIGVALGGASGQSAVGLVEKPSAERLSMTSSLSTPNASATRPAASTSSTPSGPGMSGTAPIPLGHSSAVGAIAPTAPGRYKVQFTADAELRDKIVRAQALLRHQVPNGDLAAAVDRAMTLLLRELERARFAATPSPRKQADEVDPTPSSRSIPAPIRRAVWTRDEGRCTFRSARGERCSATERLEFHHVIPFARGGDHSLENVRLACSRHNAYQAELDFGAACIAAARRRDALHADAPVGPAPPSLGL